MLAKKLAGKFIVFDGPDGCGKSTQRDRLARYLTDSGINVVLARDPGGTEAGERIRHILLHHDIDQLDVRCETFLFMASRAQLAGKVIEPALHAGKTVLCDRYISATIAYQGAAGYDTRKIVDLARYAVSDTFPNLTVILDVDPELGLERTRRRSESNNRDDAEPAGRNRSRNGADAMESRSLQFHKDVRANFLNLPQDYPGLVRIVDATPDPDTVHSAILEIIEREDF